MARSRALPIGEGAVCSVLVNKLRPSRTVAKALPNAAANQRVEDQVATCHAVITRSGQMYDTIYFTLLSLPGVEISAAQRHVIINVPGHSNAIWTHFVAHTVRAPIVTNLPPIVAATQTIGNEIFFAQNCAEDIARVRAEGFEVDDDNDPAPKNVPGFFDVPPVVDGGVFEGQSWGWGGIDFRLTVAGDMTNNLSLMVSPPSGRPTSSSSCTSSRWHGSPPSYCHRQVQVLSMQVPHL